MTPLEVAKSLNADQRKYLRRVGKGKSFPNRMACDKLFKKFYNSNIPEPPKGDDLNIVTWCDWEAQASFARPCLTEYGEQVHAELMKLDDERRANGTFYPAS